MSMVCKKYDEEVKSLITKNIDDVIENPSHYMEKIQNAARDIGVPVDEYIDKLKEGNRVYAYVVFKNPTKQNIQENFQVEYIKKYLDIPIIIQGKNKGLRFKYKNEETNSIDALIGSGNDTFVMLKLISKLASGGSQKEQRENIEKWFRIASRDLVEQGKQNTTKLIAIMDDNNPKPIEYYHNVISTDYPKENVFVGNSDEFIKWWNKEKIEVENGLERFMYADAA